MSLLDMKKYCGSCGKQKTVQNIPSGTYSETTGKEYIRTVIACRNPQCKQGKITLCPSVKKNGKHKLKFWAYMNDHDVCKTCPYDVYSSSYDMGF